MDQQGLLEIVKEMAFGGRDYESIVTELEKHKGSIPEESMNLVKRKIDDYIVTYQLGNQERSKALNQVFIGVFLFLFGMGITGYTYLSSNSQYVLAFGAILSGAWVAKEEYKSYRKPIEELIPRKNIFRR